MWQKRLAGNHVARDICVSQEQLQPNHGNQTHDFVEEPYETHESCWSLLSQIAAVTDNKSLSFGNLAMF